MEHLCIPIVKIRQYEATNFTLSSNAGIQEVIETREVHL